MENSALKRLLADSGIEGDFSCSPLNAEASARSYCRVHIHDPGSVLETVILCEGLPTPYPENDDFLVIQKFLSNRGIPVPEIQHVDYERGALLLSDAGNVDLCRLINETHRNNDIKRQQLLFQAIDIMLAMHRLDPPEVVAHRAFDSTKLRQEMDFLLENLEAVCSHYKIQNPISYEADVFLSELCDKLGMSEPKVFTHRDFHGRNIMVVPRQERAQMIFLDFQDARMGLPWYDLASLLYDPYSNINLKDRTIALEYFLKARPELRNQRGLFYAQALQRVLKALGTYLHQSHVKQNPRYLESIGPALIRAEEVIQLGRFPDSIYLAVAEMRRRLVPIFESRLPENAH